LAKTNKKGKHQQELALRRRHLKFIVLIAAIWMILNSKRIYNKALNPLKEKRARALLI